jgi:flagellar assembly factor FliW
MTQTLQSPWLGEVELNTECTLEFPAGMPGFEEHHRIMPVEIPAQRPLVYLQSLENAEVCFVALPVYVIDPLFHLCLSDEERLTLQLPENQEPVIGADVLCLALLMPADHSVAANLNTPIVINLHNRLGVQCTEPAGLPATFTLSADSGWVASC